MLELRQSGYAQLLMAEGKAEALLESRRVSLNEAMRTKIRACQDLDLLKQWLMMAIEGHDAELRQQVEALKGKAA